MKPAKQLPQPVGIWIRVSTEDQARGESPENHEARARAYAYFKQWNVVEVYNLAGVSGKTVWEHPECKRMLEDVKKGKIKALIFSKLARLARNTKELLSFAELFEEADADLISLQESIDTSTPAGRLFYTVIGAMAQWEREEIASRVAASVPIRAQLGKPLGGQAPFGYQWVDRKLVPHPDEAPTRVLLYELFKEHRRKRTVARILNERGYKTRNNGKWSDTTIERLIRDTTAKGIRTANRTKSRGAGKGWDIKSQDDWITVPVEAIVSEELWQDCNDILDQMKATSQATKPSRKPTNLFAGLVFCHCGSKMYVRVKSPRYVCHNCKNKITPDVLEQIYIENLKNYLIDPKEVSNYLNNAQKEVDESKRRKQTLTKRLGKIDKEMEGLLDLYYKHQVSAETFGQKFKPLETEKVSITDEIARIEGILDALNIEKISADVVYEEGNSLYDSWPTLSFEEKRQVIENMTRRIDIGEKEITIKLVYFPSSKEVAKGQHINRDSSPQPA